MQVGVIFASIMVYALAIFLWRRDHTPTYFVALLAAHLAVLLSPFWQALYVFRYSEDFPTFYRLGSVGFKRSRGCKRMRCHDRYSWVPGR